MAALDLHRGVDGGVCVWSRECVDLLDSFDSEIEQWEEQLQDVQRKIEELYKVVEARRGANESRTDPNAHLDIALLAVDKAIGCPATGHHGGKAKDFNNASVHANIGPNYDHNGFPDSQRYGIKRDQDVTLDILDGYLGLKTVWSQHEPRGDPNSKCSGNPTLSSHEDRSNQRPVRSRTGSVSQCEFEEAQKRRNHLEQDPPSVEPQVRRVSWKTPILSPENSSNKPPLKQRDGPHVPARTAHFTDATPQQDRRCPMVDRRCVSPSVLRKFCAMLQENEGKTLFEDGTVTTLLSNATPKSPKAGGNRAPKHVPFQQCAKDSEVPPTLQNGEHRGMRTGIQTSQWAAQGAEIQSEPRMVERIVGNCAAFQHEMKCNSHSTSHQRNTPAPQQVSRQSSPLPTRRTFSRPARPVNQRPPSRWASHTPSAKTATPARPRSRSLSPACKSEQRFCNFSSYTETVIM